MQTQTAKFDFRTLYCIDKITDKDNAITVIGYVSLLF